MINLLGKRPFVGRSDDMDKWLDENQGTHERSAPPPLEETHTADGSAPAPVAVVTRVDAKLP
jgi:AFG3 family protein